MLLPGSPCSCHPYSSLDVPSAPALVHFQASFLSLLPITGTSRDHLSQSSAPPNPGHPCWSSLPNSTSWVRDFTMAQTTAIAVFSCHGTTDKVHSGTESQIPIPALSPSLPAMPLVTLYPPSKLSFRLLLCLLPRAPSTLRSHPPPHPQFLFL